MLVIHSPWVEGLFSSLVSYHFGRFVQDCVTTDISLECHIHYDGPFGSTWVSRLFYLDSITIHNTVVLLSISSRKTDLVHGSTVTVLILLERRTDYEKFFSQVELLNT